jgi:hypothetical protein
MKRILTSFSLVLTLLGCSLSPSLAQTSYQTPPQSIANLFNAPATPSVFFSKDGSLMMILEKAASPSIEDLAQPELRIAGIRINPAVSGQSRAAALPNNWSTVERFEA